MKILVVSLEGLGNSILSTPLISALNFLGHQVFAATNYSRSAGLVYDNWGKCTAMKHPDFASNKYDIIVRCHPGIGGLPRVSFFTQREVVAYPPGSGFERYKKHEVLHYMEIARALGFTAPIPNCRVDIPVDPTRNMSRLIAIGIGYLKHPKQSWDFKHWGNENYTALCDDLADRGWVPVMVGDLKDYEVDGKAIGSAISCCSNDIYDVANKISHCRYYIGNDTGLMHVASAVEVPCVMICKGTNIVKNHPWGVRWRAVDALESDQASAVKQIVDFIGD